MEEYEIRDVMRRSETPDLKIEFVIGSQQLAVRQETGSPRIELQLDAMISNDAEQPAEYAVIRLFVDRGLEIVSSGDCTLQDTYLNVGPNEYPIWVLTTNWGIPKKLPIFYHPFRVCDGLLQVAVPELHVMQQQHNPAVMPQQQWPAWMHGGVGRYLLGYEIRSPRMIAKHGYTELILESQLVRLSGGYLTPLELSATRYGTVPDQTHLLGPAWPRQS